ncbi:hypothetical protein GPJ56_002978 [Histomonas meleagridis]|uniref:uncharacterized protein n=1 Tax=Histomonas meleagridis TaxID=135588 RepID=UPI00355A9B98|nr:hypothetical protein GPJ56_002978 [Histomonas meleagridis]KAH0796635.1 hypothetical protein GO595_010528 [Histomonas meleagridis]
MGRRKSNTKTLIGFRINISGMNSMYIPLHNEKISKKDLIRLESIIPPLQKLIDMHQPPDINFIPPPPSNPNDAPINDHDEFDPFFDIFPEETSEGSGFLDGAFEYDFDF